MATLGPKTKNTKCTCLFLRICAVSGWFGSSPIFLHVPFRRGEAIWRYPVVLLLWTLMSCLIALPCHWPKPPISREMLLPWNIHRTSTLDRDIQTQFLTYL